MYEPTSQADRLYELLPVVYRERDADRGYPLRALLRIVEVQADLVERNIGQLWDDFFVETCRPWVIPYIGDLVSNRLLFDSSRLPAEGTAERIFKDLSGSDLKPPIAIRTRADVAKTIYYRRRKGTLPMLEELARDVTGWPAHAVEFFELLGWTQHLEHLRFRSHWVDVRSVDRMNRIGGAFDEVSHTVDVRQIAQAEGWHNVPNIGLFLFRLGSYKLQRVPAREASDNWQYHFSPLGNPSPLFSRWRREGDAAGLANELHVPAPIRRAFHYEDLRRYRNLDPPRPGFTDLYGSAEDMETSFFIFRNGAPIMPTANPDSPPEVFQPQIVCHQLDPWPPAQPSGQIIAVDPETGRMAIGDGWPDATDTIDVNYHYGFPANLGGGSYDRNKWLLRPGVAPIRLFVQQGAAPTANTFPNLMDALLDWANRDRPNTLITILDSRSYDLPGAIALPNEGFLVIEAANLMRPLLKTSAGGLQIDTPSNPADPTREAVLTLSGLLIEGHLHVTGDLAGLRLLHSTVVPGRSLTQDGTAATTNPSVMVEPGPTGAEINTELRIEIAFSITGALSVPGHARDVQLLDSILDGLDVAGDAYGDGAGSAGPELHLERSTVFGRIAARSLDMSESIATGQINTVRTQDGCVRFSYVRPGSRTPRRFRCQPDLAIASALAEGEDRDPSLTDLEREQIRAFAEGSVVPGFVSDQYGQPPYAQLRLVAPAEIRTGAEDGSEMGAYCHLKQPQRVDNLRLRLEEYLPFGLEANTIFVT